jgi:DNA-binding NtrC family response regulator
MVSRWLPRCDTQPDALTLLVSGYPDVKSAMDAILLEADDIIVKPFEAGKLAEMVHEKQFTRNLPPG